MSWSIGQIVLFGIVVLYAGQYALRKHRYTKQARDWSCQSPVSVPSGIFGISAFRGIVDAAKKGSLTPYSCDLHGKYGWTFTQKMLGQTVVSSAEPENIKAVLATQFSDFSIGYRGAAYEPLFGHNTLTTEGAAWSHARTLLRPQFTRDKTSNVDRLAVHVQNLINALPKNGASFDIQDLFFRLTMDTTTDLFFGESANSLLALEDDQDNSSKNEFAQAFDLAQDRATLRFRANALYWLINPKDFREAIKIAHKFTNACVARALQNTAPDAKQLPGNNHKFLEEVALQTRDPKFLRDQALGILLAGRDTTGSLMSSVFYFLARHPKVWERLRREIIETFGSDRDDDDDGINKTPISYSSLTNCKYLNHVLNETMRLLPPAPFNVRYAKKDMTLPRGGGVDGLSPIHLKKGESVRISFGALYRRQDLWGPDADKFRPERWETHAPKGWEFLPFSGGPRNCLGQQFALTEASYAIVKLLQRFDVLENAADGPDLCPNPRLNQSLTVSHRDGVWVRFDSSEK